MEKLQTKLQLELHGFEVDDGNVITNIIDKNAAPEAILQEIKSYYQKKEKLCASHGYSKEHCLAAFIEHVEVITKID